MKYLHIFLFALVARNDGIPTGEIVEGPNIPYKDFRCGYQYVCAVYFGSLTGSYDDTVNIYYLNKTAEKLEAQGFQVKVLKMNEDAIANMTYTNGTFTEELNFKTFAGVAPAGGEPAEPQRAQYMAQLGERNGEKIEFLCDGVLINRQWVLTAAHCFFSPLYDINMVRLGDYDITEPVADDKAVHGKRIEDYPVTDVIFYPDYSPDVRYHDLALVPLPRKTPHYSPSINPVCLPWDYTNEDFIGREVVLTGWGATQYGGNKTPLLQQVKLKVFDPLVCNTTYSTLPKFRKKHPEGLTKDNIMCIGWHEAGKDACNGDSGAPVVFGEKNIYGRFILAGIVSGGYGCGLKEYPGLYIPVNKPKYLRWIKKVAFKDYE